MVCLALNSLFLGTSTGGSTEGERESERGRNKSDYKLIHVTFVCFVGSPWMGRTARAPLDDRRRARGDCKAESKNKAEAINHQIKL